MIARNSLNGYESRGNIVERYLLGYGRAIRDGAW